MARFLTYLEYGFYIAMLFFVIPIKIDKESVEDSFTEYNIRFNKSYENQTVYNLRLEAFKNSLETIETLNQNRTNNSAIYGITKFSDLHPEEFQTKFLTTFLHQEPKDDDSSEENYFNKRSAKELPKKVDWRSKNIVTKVKNQNQCGACWAFSTIETVESMNAMKTGKLEELSVQQMIDCSTFNRGCEGGDMCSLLQWMIMTKAKVVTETTYPLTKSNDKCRRNDTWSGVQISEFNCGEFVGNEDVMLELIAYIGPITVAVDAKTWQNYAGGIIQYHCNSKTRNLNHAVQIVGYDLTAEIPHYIARNTWGEDFGDNGYVYIAIGDNVCGIANQVAALKVL